MVTPPTVDRHVLSALPRLAWLAVVDPGAARIMTVQGDAVESGDGWFVEGVWDGPFESAAFHRAEHFFGSGLHWADGRVVCVPSTALVDRLVYAVHEDRLIVANSVPLLLGLTGARLDAAHPYDPEANASLKGIWEYRREFRVVHPEGLSVQQLYHQNLVWDGRTITFEPRSRARTFASFEEYDAAVRDTLRRIHENYASGRRRRPMVGFTTLSSGYDSPAAAALVRPLGVDTCFTSLRSNSSMPRWLNPGASSDDGRPVAEALDLRIVRLERDGGEPDADEIYFYATAPGTTEAVFHVMGRYIAEHGPAVVFTGYHGDKLWDVHTSGRYLQDDIRRGDTSGLSLAEFRLASGFVNVPIPFIFGRSVQSLNAIARSAAMAPWRLGNSYDRPIARRIVESAGVPRAAFGMRKQAVVATHRYPDNAELRRDYVGFVRRQCGVGLGVLRLQQVLDGAAFRLARVVDYARAALGGRRPTDPMFAHGIRTRKAFFWKRVRPDWLLYYWAVSRLSDRAAAALREGGVSSASATEPR